MLTSGEVLQLLQAHGLALSALPSAPLDSLLGSEMNHGTLAGVPGGSGNTHNPTPFHSMDQAC